MDATTGDEADAVLTHLRDDDEIRISTTTRGGDPVSVIIWSAVVERMPYVRSVHGAEGAWYRRATARDGNGVELDGRVHPVGLEHVDDEAELAAVDAAFRAKYGSRWPGDTEALMTPESRACTLRVRLV